MPIDRTNRYFLAFVAAVRQDPRAAGPFSDWLQEHGAEMADVLELYALPPPWPTPVVLGFNGLWPNMVELVQRADGQTVVLPESSDIEYIPPDYFEDDSLRSLLVKFAESVEPTLSRPGCLYWRWQEAALQKSNGKVWGPWRELKRRVLSLWDGDVKWYVEKVFRVEELNHIDAAAVRVTRSGAAVLEAGWRSDVLEHYGFLPNVDVSNEPRERETFLFRQVYRPSDLIPPVQPRSDTEAAASDFLRDSLMRDLGMGDLLSEDHF